MELVSTYKIYICMLHTQIHKCTNKSFEKGAVEFMLLIWVHKITLNMYKYNSNTTHTQLVLSAQFKKKRFMVFFSSTPEILFNKFKVTNIFLQRT